MLMFQLHNLKNETKFSVRVLVIFRVIFFRDRAVSNIIVCFVLRLSPVIICHGQEIFNVTLSMVGNGLGNYLSWAGSI